MGWILLVVISVTAAAAQIVMKYAANASSSLGIFNPKVLAIILASFAISCAGQLVWFYALRYASLSTSYLFLSLVFVLVPLAGWWLFSETLQPLHFLSMGLILSGVAVLGFAGRGG
jgi:undecaprenyl phosphate-alpha-L-ara4N flippase subunit ArnE